MNFLLFGSKPPPSEQQRSITLSDRIVPYTIKRSPRRRISLSIDHRGLRVLGPVNLTISAAESLVREHQHWVITKLDEWRPERMARGWQLNRDTALPLLGVAHQVSTQTHTARSPRIERLDNALILHSKEPLDTAHNHRALVQWLRVEAMQCFEGRVAHYAQLLGVSRPPLSLSQARTRWGSCTSHGHIRLNWRLVHLPLELIDYVVAHELAHLKEMNHSARFWAVVASIYPDWKQARLTLRTHTKSLPVIEL